MPLQQSKGNGTAQRVEEQIDIRVGTDLAPLNRALQHRAGHFSAALGELRQERLARAGVHLGFRNQPEKRRAGNRSRLQMHYSVDDVPEVAGNISCIGHVEFPAGNAKMQIHA